MPQIYPQEHIATALQSMLPTEWSGLKVPFLEDLLNQEPFTMFEEYHREQGTAASVYPPQHFDSAQRAAVDAALGIQWGALGSKRSVGPLIQKQGGARRHLREALDIARHFHDPSNAPIPAEEDLRYAAIVTVNKGEWLRKFRCDSAKRLRAVAQPCSSLNRHFLGMQHPAVASISGSVNIVFIAILIIIMRWPDRKLPRRFVIGFNIAGRVEESGVFPKQVSGIGMSTDILLQRHEQRLREWGRQPPDKHVEFLVKCCRKDTSRGFGTELLTKTQLDTKFGKKGWCSNPRFSIEQSSGKIRPIDDGKRSGINDATSFEEKLCLCSALQPCIGARLIIEESAGSKDLVVSHPLESGGEDLPDAFRHVPIHPDDHRYNIVAVRVPGSDDWKFQVVWGHLFGHASAVINFNRVSNFVGSSREEDPGGLSFHVLR